MNPNADLLSLPQAARLVGVSTSHMHRLVAAGAIAPVARVPAGALFTRAAATALAEERRRNPPRAGRPRKRPEALAA